MRATCLIIAFLIPITGSFHLTSRLTLSSAPFSSYARPHSARLSAATLPPPPTTKTVVTVNESSQDFVFGLNDDLVRERGRKTLVLEGDDLTTKPYQILLVTFTFLIQFLLSTSAITSIFHSHASPLLSLLLTTTTILTTYTLADLGSGIFHWSVDNYGNSKTPILGNIIAAFQGHHTAPWTITERGFCNNVHKLCYPFGVLLPGLSYFMGNTGVGLLSLTLFCWFEVMSQELHKWTHQTSAETNKTINWLQKNNLILSRKTHNKHHTMPFDGNYCIVSGWNNGWLDRSGFLRWMELRIWERNGVESNSWKLDEGLKERTMRGEFRPE